jgi:hypothetical protein
MILLRIKRQQKYFEKLIHTVFLKYVEIYNEIKFFEYKREQTLSNLIKKLNKASTYILNNITKNYTRKSFNHKCI